MEVKKVKDYIVRHQLLVSDKLYLVAVSGGADSVALLIILKELGIRIEVVHCNFQLRGEESNRDEQFVADLCEAHHIPLHRIHFDTRAYAAVHKVSIEMAARELRYRYFEQLRCDIGAEAVCVAHHRDDNVETVLINLMRGTGIHGLVGIRPKNGHIVRPLLCLSRQEIEYYLANRHQAYVTDSTNLIDDVQRNKVRINLLPLMRSINSAVFDNIQMASEQMAEAERIYNHSIDTGLRALVSENSVSIEALLQQPSASCFLYEWLRQYGFSPAVIRQIAGNLHAASGRLWRSATHELLADRGMLVLEPKQEQLPSLRIPETGTYIYRGRRKEERGTWEDAIRFVFTVSDQVEISRLPDVASLDADKVCFPLTIRPVQKADRFVPFGMKCSRLLSDYLTDLKLSLFERRRQLVVCDASGNIVWVVGRRTSQCFCVDSHSTRLLLIRFSRPA